MANMFLLGNYAQSTVALPIGSGDASFVLASSGAFVVPASSPQQQQGVVRIDDTGNASWNQITGPFEIAYFTVNTTGTNTLSGLVRGREGTTGKAFSAGATVSQSWTVGGWNQVGRLDVQALQSASGPIQFPQSAGGTYAATNYGSVPNKIYQTVLGSPAASVSFASIPNVYSHLLVEMIARSDQAALVQECGLQFNSDVTAGHYQWERLTASGTTVVAVDGTTGDTSIAHFYIPGTTSAANFPGYARIWVPLYAGTTFNKVARIESSVINSATFPAAAAVVVDSVTGFWNSTAAIATVTLLPLSGNFITGSTFTVYGIP